MDPRTDLAGLGANADAAAAYLKLLANENRLRILCHLAEVGEMSVNALADSVGLSQSALSQHLAKLREEELVSFRREAQTLFYSLADKRTLRMMKLLKQIFCD